ncbi:MAG TPA: L,D-transpeptidase, partial [Candidatus Nanopelagicales bacterium]|nr:L,D-transpeptidase [Candidatus Nanopelagicales bacterium]
TQRRVGVGYPLLVTFAHPVKRKGATERRLEVKVDGKPIKGAWSWRDSYTAQYRPRKGFWPGKSTIKLTATLRNSVLAVDRKPNGKPAREWKGGQKSDRVIKIKTARSFIAYIRDARHVMIVKKNGKPVYHPIPVSLGKPGFATRSGIKVATEKYYVKRMVNTELDYDVQSPFSVRITPTGEFIHGAPWATGRLGRYDGSHGCTNLGVSDAKWYYDHVIYGDPVVTTGTGRPMEWTNGLGGPWNIPWRDWLARSALKGKA